MRTHNAFLINLGKHIAALTKKNWAKRGPKIDPKSDRQLVLKALPKVLTINPEARNKVIRQVAKRTCLPVERTARALNQCNNIGRRYGWWWLIEP